MQPEELSEVAKAMRRRLATMRSSCDEMEAMLNSLVGEKKKIKEMDENGEPTWIYAAKVPIPKDIYLTKKFLEYGNDYGFDEGQMKVIMHGAQPGSASSYEGFIKYYTRNAANKNGKWSHWSLVFQKWVREQRERKTNKENGVHRPTRHDRAAIRE